MRILSFSALSLTTLDSFHPFHHHHWRVGMNTRMLFDGLDCNSPSRSCSVAAGSASAQTSTGQSRELLQAAVFGRERSNPRRNIESGIQRTTLSHDQGFYVLPGHSGTYDVTVRRIGSARKRDVSSFRSGHKSGRLPSRRAGRSAERGRDISGVGYRTRTSEVATNVTPQQIRSCPLPVATSRPCAALAWSQRH